MSKKPKSSTTVNVVKADPLRLSADVIDRAAGMIKKGGVVVFPTRCLYGLGADAFNTAAVDRIYALKQRPIQNPILVLIGHPEQLERLAKTVSRAARCIMAHFWPGRVTLVFEAHSSVPANLTAGTGKIGVRMPGHAVASALVRAVQTALTGTSANLSGGPGCDRIADLDPRIARQVDLILDAGTLKGGKGSTVVDVSGVSPRILREGEVSEMEIFASVAEQKR